MPLNGPIQSDGQELKAACTQKPLGSREGSSLGFAHGKGGHPTTKGSVKTSLTVFNDIPPTHTHQPPTAEKCPSPHSDNQRPRALHEEAAEIYIQQTSQKASLLSVRCRPALKGASVCRLVRSFAAFLTPTVTFKDCS